MCEHIQLLADPGRQRRERPESSVQRAFSNSKAPCTLGASTRGQCPLGQATRVPVPLLLPGNYAAAEYFAISMNFCSRSPVMPWSLESWDLPRRIEGKGHDEEVQAMWCCKYELPLSQEFIQCEVGTLDDRMAVAKYRQICNRHAD